MTQSRSAAVVIATTAIAVVAMTCTTVLIAAGRLDAGQWAGTLSVMVVPAVMIMLGAQQSANKRDITDRVNAVHDLVNGGLELRIADVVRQVLAETGLLPATPQPPPPQLLSQPGDLPRSVPIQRGRHHT